MEFFRWEGSRDSEPAWRHRAGSSPVIKTSVLLMCSEHCSGCRSLVSKTIAASIRMHSCGGMTDFGSGQTVDGLRA